MLGRRGPVTEGAETPPARTPLPGGQLSLRERGAGGGQELAPPCREGLVLQQGVHQTVVGGRSDLVQPYGPVLGVWREQPGEARCGDEEGYVVAAALRIVAEHGQPVRGQAGARRGDSQPDGDGAHVERPAFVPGVVGPQDQQRHQQGQDQLCDRV